MLCLDLDQHYQAIPADAIARVLTDTAIRDFLLAESGRLAADAEAAMAVQPEELEQQLRESVVAAGGDVEGMERAIAEAHAVDVECMALQEAIRTAAARLMRAS